MEPVAILYVQAGKRGSAIYMLYPNPLPVTNSLLLSILKKEERRRAETGNL
jgi:hypothetical protein